MKRKQDSSCRLLRSPKLLYQAYASAVAFIAVKLPNGDQSIGSAFHVGEGVFLTARHVVENVEILKIANTVGRLAPDPNGNVVINQQEGRYRSIEPATGRIAKGPYFHPDKFVDVAALVVDGIECPAIPLGGHLDDFIDDDAFILRETLIMGYPPVPLSSVVLVASRGEVNAVVDKYIGGHPQFVLSSMARGGFSGGPCLIDFGFALGMVTESLNRNHLPTELGYMSIISVEPLLVCLAHHGILPSVQKEGSDGFWDDWTSPWS